MNLKGKISPNFIIGVDKIYYKQVILLETLLINAQKPDIGTIFEHSLNIIILTKYLSFPNVNSWLFVPEGLTFFANGTSVLHDSQIPFVFEGTLFDTTFIGIKMGDVDLTAVANSTMTPPVPVDTAKMLFYNQQVSAGDTVEVLFFAEEPLVASQFTIDLNGVRLNPGMTGETDNIALLNGHVTVAMHKDCLRLSFIAETNGQLKDMLTVSGVLTEALGFRANGDMLALTGSALEATTNILEQDWVGQWTSVCQPNPWYDRAQLPFKLPVASDVTLTITDAMGRICYRQSQYFPSGNHNIPLSNIQLTASGTYYWVIQAGGHRAAGHFVRLNR